MKFRMVAELIVHRREGPQYREQRRAGTTSLPLPGQLSTTCETYLFGSNSWEYHDLVNTTGERRLHQHAFSSETTITQKKITSGVRGKQTERTTRSNDDIQELGSR
eukprot:1595847-Amphidinium_carterae.1